MEGRVLFNTHALLQEVLSGFSCRHQWSEGDSTERRIICNKCGLKAYVPHLEHGNAPPALAPSSLDDIERARTL